MLFRSLAIARGEACALLLASDAIAADGSAAVVAGGLALAAVAAERAIPILLVGTASDAPSPDAADLERRIVQAEWSELYVATRASVAARSVAAGVTVRSPRYEILPASVAELV